jgi:hypothetical protein
MLVRITRGLSVGFFLDELSGIDRNGRTESATPINADITSFVDISATARE